MTPPMGRTTVVLGGILLVTMMGCGVFRPSVEEIRTELAHLIDPALDAGLAGADRPEANVSGGYCHEPLIGPADGIRPLLSYTFSFSILDDPEAFLDRVEDYWRGQGLEVEINANEESRILYSGNDGYSISAGITYDSMEVRIGGTGPCVDNPDRKGPLDVKPSP